MGLSGSWSFSRLFVYGLSFQQSYALCFASWSSWVIYHVLKWDACKTDNFFRYLPLELKAIIAWRSKSQKYVLSTSHWLSTGYIIYHDCNISSNIFLWLGRLRAHLGSYYWLIVKECNRISLVHVALVFHCYSRVRLFFIRIITFEKEFWVKAKAKLQKDYNTSHHFRWSIVYIFQLSP